MVTEEEEIISSFTAFKTEFSWNRSYFETWLQKIIPNLGKNRHIYKILANDKEAGWLLTHFIGKRCAKFNALIIYPSFRNRDIGTETLHKVIQEISSEIDWIFTQCRENDSTAIKLVRKVGFTKIGSLKHIEEDALNFVFVYNNTSSTSLESANEIAEEIYNQIGKQIFALGN